MRTAAWFLGLGLVWACSGTDERSGGGGDPDDGIAVEGDGGSACTKELTFENVAIERPEPFDVIIVADHSGSVGWSRENLAAGLQDLLGHVHGQEVRFFVLTPTQYGASTEAADPYGVSEQLFWADPVTGEPFQNAATEYRQTCTDPSGSVIDCEGNWPERASYGVNVEGVWELERREPIAAITPEMSRGQVEAEQAKVAAAILALGTEGAQHEQPICTLSRYIRQAPELLPRHAVFLILSDEDDVSTPDQCLARYNHDESYFGTRDQPCTENCDYFQCSATAWHYTPSVAYQCAAVDDQGMPQHGHGWSGSTSSSEWVCNLEPERPCTTEEMAVAIERCGPGYVVDSCVWQCDAASRSGRGCALEQPEMTGDPCTQSFVVNGITYANFSDYCNRTMQEGVWSDCKKQGYEVGTEPLYGSSETYTNVVEVETLDEMVVDFKEKADAAFGEGGYFVSLAIHDPSFSCTVHPGQSYGTTLKRLATSPEDVLPLCGQYAPALQRIQTFARRLVRNEFRLQLREGVSIERVEAVDIAGQERQLSTNEYRHDPNTNTLHVTPGVLGPADLSLQVTVGECSVE